MLVLKQLELEEGRGFAVVANEIQKLSQQTSELVEAIDRESQDLLQSVSESNESLEQIIEATENQYTEVIKIEEIGRASCRERV